MTHLLRLVAFTAALMMLVAVGCATSFAYRHADWLLTWKINQYVDLTGEQRRFVRGRLKDLLQQHRYEALPMYEQVLMTVKHKAMDGLTRDELDWIFDRYHELRSDLVRRAAPDGALLLTSINEAQVRHLEQTMKQEIDKAKRRVTEDPESREARRGATAVHILKDWLGSLSWEQEQRVRGLVRVLPDTESRRLAYLDARQQELLEWLRTHPDAQALSARLHEWIVFPEHVSADFAQSEKEKLEGLKSLALAVDGFITHRQRTYALGRLQSLIDDMHALAAS